jgi:hypothetical protein
MILSGGVKATRLIRDGMDSIKTDFRPLTHHEIMEDKPLLVKIGDSEVYYKSNLQDIKNLTLLWSNKNYLLSALTSIATDDTMNPQEKTIPLVSCYKGLLDMVYEISSKPKKRKELKLFKKTYYSYYSEHSQAFFKLFQMILEYNTRLFFLLSYLQNLQIQQTQEYLGMEREPYSVEKGWLESAKERISNIPHLKSMKKKKDLWHSGKANAVGSK